MKLKIATSQFPVSAGILRNYKYIAAQIKVAKLRGAHVLHLPEASLSGYAGVDFISLKNMKWEILKDCTQKVLKLARDHRIWIILGSTHPLTGKNKPHNSLYIINANGEIVDRYDKMFCAGNRSGTSVDLAHYTSGNHFSTFKINGIKCGALICHDYRYPELYREYKQKDIQVMFHSYHAGGIPSKRFKQMQNQVGKQNHAFNRSTTIPGITMPATMQSYAANNYMWISCSNSSARESCWPAFIVQPDGVITGRLRRNTTGLLISNIDTKNRYYDSTVDWRKRAMKGIYHSGKIVEDERSRNRNQL